MVATCRNLICMYMSPFFLVAVDTYSRPLANFASLKILRLLPSPDGETPPFSLQRLISREYHIGEAGILIGHGQECGVTVPLEAGLQEKHILVKWIPGTVDPKYRVQTSLNFTTGRIS